MVAASFARSTFSALKAQDCEGNRLLVSNPAEIQLTHSQSMFDWPGWQCKQDLVMLGPGNGKAQETQSAALHTH